VGAKTHREPGVKREIRIAGDEGVVRYQVRSADKDYPWVDGGGTRLTWTWPNLKKYLY